MAHKHSSNTIHKMAVTPTKSALESNTFTKVGISLKWNNTLVFTRYHPINLLSSIRPSFIFYFTFFRSMNFIQHMAPRGKRYMILHMEDTSKWIYGILRNNCDTGTVGSIVIQIYTSGLILRAGPVTVTCSWIQWLLLKI